MVKETDQDKLNRLDKLDQANRDRVGRFMDKQKQAGNRHISGIISEAAYNELSRRKDAAREGGERPTTGAVFTQLLMADIFSAEQAEFQSAIDELSFEETLADTNAVLDTVPDSVKDSFPPLDTATDIIDNFILDRHKKGGRGGTLMLKEIAQAFMDAGIKTVKGLDVWKPGTVDTAFKAAIKRQEGKS